MEICRICDRLISNIVYSREGPSLTSVKEIVDIPLKIYLCSWCSLLQKDSLENIKEYYSGDYNISMQSYGFDQLHYIENGKFIYRTGVQAVVVLGSGSMKNNAIVLDYGCGKATTLKHIIDSRPDIIPYVFDVSDSYREVWDTFIPKENQASFIPPESWDKKFDLITAFFVLEHTDNLYELLENVYRLLKDNGTFLFMVPNILTNLGDFLVVDHINHFSEVSLKELLFKAGFNLYDIEANKFRGAFICRASKKDISKFTNEIDNIVNFYTSLDRKLDAVENVPTAIFGAGVYGSYIYMKIKDRCDVKYFLEDNVHLIGTELLGLPIISSKDISDDIEVIYVGLNPDIARSVIDPIKGIQYIFLD
jgi:SAM-dependent methyltransferase